MNRELALDLFCMLLAGVGVGTTWYLVYEFRSVILP